MLLYFSRHWIFNSVRDEKTYIILVIILLKTGKKFLQCVLLDEAHSTLKEVRMNVLLVLSLLDFSILLRPFGLLNFIT